MSYSGYRTLLPRVVSALGAILFLLSPSCSSWEQSSQPTAPGSPPEPRRVILVLVDGLRWQEVFTGAEDALLNKEYGGVGDAAAVREQFWRETADARRQALMPFFWTTIATEGQLIGNQHTGGIAQVANGLNFSYPGYSEMICGFVDPAINSNDRKLNPNVTVLEWLNQQPGFEGRVAVFGAWDVVAWIVNQERCGFFVNAGWEPVPADAELSERAEFLNELKTQLPRRWPAEPDDAIAFHAALEYLKQHHPRVMWITLGETDEFAHEVRYDLYLQSAYRTDAMIRRLWETIQSIDGYRDNTTLIVTTDHGRGTGPKDWPNHGEKVSESQYVWMAILGPDTPPLGERDGTLGGDAGPILLAQIAATLAEAVGQDYPTAQPRAAPAIAGAIDREGAGRPLRERR